MIKLSKAMMKIADLPSKKLVKSLPDFEYADDPMIEKIIFICGLHRSGTTLLERLLASQFEVSYLRANVPESEGQHMQTVYSPAVRYGGPGKFAFSIKAREEIQALTDYPAHGEKIMSEWQRFVIGKSPVLIEKSPPNLTKIGWLRKVFPASRFVMMTRDPRAVASATQKWSKTSLPELMMHWNAAYTQALEDFEENDCTLLRYEDLMDNTAKELERIAHFLNLAPRQSFKELEGRHHQVINTNGKYIKSHLGTKYGFGIWDQLGYKV